MRSGRRGLAVLAIVALGWSVARAGIDAEVVNERGWSSVARFWAAAARPELAVEFLRLTVSAAGVTLGFAVLGTATALALGSAGALLLSDRVWERAGPPSLRRLTSRSLLRIAYAVPRAIHEVLWALILVQVLGFDPLVAVIAIAIPFGAVTAKVYGEILDETDGRPFQALRAAGAGRLQATAYGLLPNAGPRLVSYGFYRLECAVRSAAVLGVIGVGGLGFQISLSFQSLRYAEIWTMLAALVVLSGVADAWSASLRRRHGGGLPVEAGTMHRARVAFRDRSGTVSLVAAMALLALSWRWVGVSPATLWSERSRDLAGDVLGQLWPPRLGPGGWAELLRAALDTLAMSLLALALAVGGGLAMAAVSRRRAAAPPPLRAASLAGRGVLLVARAVPPPVWAFVAVLVLFPGIWPGAVALGLYNLGVLGRLFAEVLEDLDPRPGAALLASGASGAQVFWYATLPSAAARLAGVALYRWEVMLRETVVVGVVGAGGIGRLLQHHLVARDFAAVTGVVGALLVLTAVVDASSSAIRRRLH